MTDTATVPAHLVAALPQGRDWEVRGEHRYRCRWPDPLTRKHTGRCCVVTAPDDSGYVVQILTPEEFEYANFDLEERAFYWLDRAMERKLLPPCVVPGCDEKAPLVFTAAEYGRLAGRDWEPGDEVRLCPAHGNDVWRAQGVYGLDELPEWLRADAALEPLDAFDASYDTIFGAEIDRSRRRMLAMRAVRD